MKMTFRERLQKLDQLHHLIKRKGTGNAEELSERLNVCPRTVYKLLDDLRHLGASVCYSRECRSYCYTEETVFHFTPFINRSGGKGIRRGKK